MVLPECAGETSLNRLSSALLITGIIDWGDASIGDPDYELSDLYRTGVAGCIEEGGGQQVAPVIMGHAVRRD